MNIIILEDIKGFRKIVEVPKFPPDYRIVEILPLGAMLNDISDYPMPKELIFYPKGEPKQEYGSHILLYKQMQ